MKTIIKYKILLFTNAVTTLTLSSLTICLGGLDIYADIRERIRQNNKRIINVHAVVALGIFFVANATIFLHISLVTFRALGCQKSNWGVGLHYFLSVLAEIVAIVVLITYYKYLHYPIPLASLTAVLSVCIFFIVLSTERIFWEVERMERDEELNKMYEKVGTRLVPLTDKVKCIRISLHESPQKAGPSHVV